MNLFILFRGRKGQWILLQLANANAENEGAKDIKLFYPVEVGMKCSA